MNFSFEYTGEMALLVEGLEVGDEISTEEYIIGPANELADDHGETADKELITLYGPEEGLTWAARSVKGQGALSLLSHHDSTESQGNSLKDPLVTLFGSVHENPPEMGSLRSTLFPNFGSMFNVAEQHPKTEQWDEESLQRGGEGYASGAGEADADDNLQSPLLSRQATSMEGKDISPLDAGHWSALRLNISPMQGNAAESFSSMGVGGGWQVACKWSGTEGADGKQGGFKRIYLHQEGVPGSMRGSLVSFPGTEVPGYGESIQAAALVSQPALYSEELMDQHLVGPAMVHPSETAAKGPRWADLLEPGVRHALLVGVSLQILQQVSI